MWKKWNGIVGMILSASVIFAGCGVSNNQQEGSSLSDNQILRMSDTGELTTLDNTQAKDVPTMSVLNNVQEGLMRLGKEKKPEEGMATSYDISEDKKVYTFYLHEDAKWSDGKPVTAYDFEYGWKRALDPKTKSEYAYILFPIKNAARFNSGQASADEVGVKAKDDRTLVVTLEKPTLNFINMTTHVEYLPQRKDIVEKYKENYGLKPEYMVYNGPFVVSSWTQQKVELVKNEKYLDKNAVSLTKVDIHIIKDVAQGINLYNSNQLDTALLNQAFVDAFKQTPDYLEVKEASTVFIMLNQKHPFFRNEKIRKAITLALDREEMVQIMKDGSLPAGALIPPTLSGEGINSFRVNGEIVKPDVAKAKELFKQGLSELNLSAPPNNVVMVSYDSTAKRDVAVNIKDQLRKKLGWDIKLDAPTWKIHVDRLSRGDYDMGMLTWTADYDDPISHFEIWQSNNPMNFSGFKNAKYDQLIEQAKNTTDAKQQFKILLEAEKILTDVQGEGQAGFVPLFYSSKAYIQKPKVKDLYRHATGASYTLKWAYIVKDKK
ncbi:peptide ABC transporter substrate-binding protein [Laceyella sacchari]|uniref:Oligopeptide transport system substrate-binding protein n=1 Tax=Laceyella tengchongensis TaxID=574699 RepID=A0AA46ACS3_9BACL|nr:peptide ABC transporter substrate-binding protein [Laceyella tengchongensis]AUS07918.1 peptide ABC transporter substrate-binding protein [Laceyella sacchari]SMP00698.1 oligopeptide transport system substrate-binding protein [Laceyella tengchongensis]